jgi:hypothetical protein
MTNSVIGSTGIEEVQLYLGAGVESCFEEGGNVCGEISIHCTLQTGVVVIIKVAIAITPIRYKIF